MGMAQKTVSDSRRTRRDDNHPQILVGLPKTFGERFRSHLGSEFPERQTKDERLTLLRSWQDSLSREALPLRYETLLLKAPFLAAFALSLRFTRTTGDLIGRSG